MTGGITYDQCCETMKQSRKIILVISNSFLRERDCLSEASFAGRFDAHVHDNCTCRYGLVVAEATMKILFVFLHLSLSMVNECEFAV